MAIVGLGSMANYHLRSFGRMDQICVRAVMSRNEDSVRRVMTQYGIQTGTLNYDDILHDRSIDCVVVCTPNSLHFRMAKEALLAGKHVLVEKPMGSSLREIRELCELSDAKGKILMVAMTARFTPQYMGAFDALRRQEIGGVIQIVVRWLESRRIGVNWEGRRVSVDERTSTVLYHQGWHMLDAALWFVDDEVDKVCALGAKRQSLNDDAGICIRTKRNKLVTCAHSFNSSRRVHDVIIVGDNGVMEIQGYEVLEVNGVRRVNTSWQQGFDQGVERQAEEFARSVHAGTVPLASGLDVLKSAEVLEEAYSQLAISGVTECQE